MNVRSTHDYRLLDITVSESAVSAILQRFLDQQVFFFNPSLPLPLVQHIPFHDVFQTLAQLQSAGSGLAAIKELVFCRFSSDRFDWE